jgi:hypothetical protein
LDRAGLELQLNSISTAGVENYRDQMALFQSDLLFTVNSHSTNCPRVKNHPVIDDVRV